MGFDTVEKCSDAAILMALWMFAIAMQNLVGVCFLSVDAGFYVPG